MATTATNTSKQFDAPIHGLSSPALQGTYAQSQTLETKTFDYQNLEKLSIGTVKGFMVKVFK